MKNCLLCLNLTFPRNSVSLYDKQECGTTIDDIIKQHFWFSNQIIDSNIQEKDAIICKTCWSKLENFHEFFCAVKFNYKISDEDPVTITEALDEDEVSEGFQVDEVEEEEVFSFEIVTVKQEDVEKVEEDSKPETEVPVKRKIHGMSEEEEIVMKQHADMKCEKCSYEIKSWSDAVTHYKTHKINRGYIRCCKRKIDRLCEMIDHCHWHQDKNIFTCKTCGKVLLTRENLQIHEGTHIPEELRKYSCDRCPKKFGHSLSLTIHKRHHQKSLLPASIPCPECPGKFFKTEDRLKLHTDFVHNSSQHMCHICSKLLKSKYSFDNHVKAHMVPEKQIECKICGHFLKNKRRFQVHMKKHKEEEDGPYPCPQCQKEYKHKDAMREHILYVHTSRRLTCEHCGKEFKHKANLREHLSQHTGAEPYSCPFCDRRFKSNANMYAHKKKMHPKEYSQLPPRSYLVPPDGVVGENEESQF